MSRIHEALKKAEQDRASSPTRESAPSIEEQRPVEVAWTRPPAEVAAGQNSVAALTTAVTSPGYVRFDDLLQKCARPTWRLDPNVNVFLDPSLSAHGAEQFRTLRSRLYQLRGTQPLKTILVTSSVPGEGKTFVTTNLSQAIVRQPDRRVLIIDADLRCARLHVPLGAPATPGLTNYLSGRADEVSIIQNGAEGNLCFIPGGDEVSDPSELLSNGRLKSLLDKLAPVFDWIILDSPPCLPVADASILSGMCDGILLVVRAGKTASELAQRSCQELQGKNILGVVLNAVEEVHSYGSYQYQAYGYGRDSKKLAEL